MANGFHGVGYDKKSKKYLAQSKIDGKKEVFGRFMTPTEAARAYDAAIRERGLERPLNFPLNFPDEVTPENIPTMPEGGWTDAPVPVPAGTTGAVSGDSGSVEYAQVSPTMTIAPSDPEAQPEPTPDETPADAPLPDDGAPESPEHAQEVVAPLTADERDAFARLVGVIHTSAKDLGEAIMEIRDRKLYREKFPTFEAFILEEFNKGRSWAYNLMDAAKVSGVLSTIGVHPENERQARELKDVAKKVETLPEPERDLIAKFVGTLTGTKTPTTSQIRAVTEVTAGVVLTGAIDDPETGESVKWVDLPEAKRMAYLQENVTTNTYERLERQKGHIATSVAATQAIKPSPAVNVSATSAYEWAMNYAAQVMPAEHELRITIRKDPAGNPKAFCQEIDRDTGRVYSEGDAENYIKQALLRFIDVVKGGAEVKS
jgi:hypothetical protein